MNFGRLFASRILSLIISIAALLFLILSNQSTPCAEIYNPVLYQTPRITASTEEVRRWLVNQLRVNNDDIAVLDSNPSLLSFQVQSRLGNVQYLHTYVSEDASATRQLIYLDVDWLNGRRITLEDALRCWGKPAYYSVTREAPVSPFYRVDLSLWYPDRGLVVVGHDYNHEPVYVVGERFPITRIRQMSTYDIHDGLPLGEVAHMTAVELRVEGLQEWTGLAGVAPLGQVSP